MGAFWYVRTITDDPRPWHLLPKNRKGQRYGVFVSLCGQCSNRIVVEPAVQTKQIMHEMQWVDDDWFEGSDRSGADDVFCEECDRLRYSHLMKGED